MTGCFSRPEDDTFAVFTCSHHWSPSTGVVTFTRHYLCIPSRRFQLGFDHPGAGATAVRKNRDRVPTTAAMRATVSPGAWMWMVRPANVFSHRGWHSRSDEAGSATTDRAAFSRQFPAPPLSHPTLCSEGTQLQDGEQVLKPGVRSHESPLLFRTAIHANFLYENSCRGPDHDMSTRSPFLHLTYTTQIRRVLHTQRYLV